LEKSNKEFDENIKETEKNFEESNKKQEAKKKEVCKKMIAVIDEKLNCLTGVGFKSSEIEKAKEMTYTILTKRYLLLKRNALSVSCEIKNVIQPVVNE